MHAQTTLVVNRPSYCCINTLILVRDEYNTTSKIHTRCEDGGDVICLRNITQMLGGNIQGAKSHTKITNITCEEEFSVIMADSNR